MVQPSGSFFFLGGGLAYIYIYINNITNNLIFLCPNSTILFSFGLAVLPELKARDLLTTKIDEDSQNTSNHISTILPHCSLNHN